MKKILLCLAILSSNLYATSFLDENQVKLISSKGQCVSYVSDIDCMVNADAWPDIAAGSFRNSQTVQCRVNIDLKNIQSNDISKRIIRGYSSLTVETGYLNSLTLGLLDTTLIAVSMLGSYPIALVKVNKQLTELENHMCP